MASANEKKATPVAKDSPSSKSSKMHRRSRSGKAVAMLRFGKPANTLLRLLHVSTETQEVR